MIRIRGARTHNLKNIDVDIPKNKFVVITGLSGSGKSSLAFDTIYAEGQRRYIESLSAYARQFLGMMEKPDVDSIEGLSPSISIEQKTTHNNPRSTVATVTEIYDYMRLLYARVGTPYSPTTGLPIEAFTVSQMVDCIKELPEGTKLIVLAPLVRDRKGEYKKLFETMIKRGFSRFKIDNNFYEEDSIPELTLTKKHTISVVVDRLIASDASDFTGRLTQSIEVALSLSQDLLWIELIDSKELKVFSTRYACPETGFSLSELEPRIFSFNSPQGACRHCYGLGQDDFGRICVGCHGSRLKEASLCVKIDNKNISEVSALSIDNALKFFEHLTFPPQKQTIADKILKEVIDRLFFLKNVGLSYLTLNRLAGTLSGGESQRIRLASQIGAQLTGVCYVLDEPSIGLHQKDNDRLLATLKNLRDIGNSVLVVEHDQDTMLACDHIIDMGPRSGFHGGEIVAQGTHDEIAGNQKSLTGLYLSKKLRIEIPQTRRHGSGNTVSVTKANFHNLKDIDVAFPLGTFICVTGVSGSGKSSLVMGTLKSSLWIKRPINCAQIDGLRHFDRLIDIDQSPIGRTPRSNPSTYTGVFDLIRDWFAGLPESKARGYKPGRFSFNVKGGRCGACDGDGVKKVSMHFLPDVYTTCDVCKGRRFNRETLEVLYNGRSISDVLEMSVDEALVFFKHHHLIIRKLETLRQTGLGYIKLGQASTTLSGGEAQRVKLSKELSKRTQGRGIYILDEPTTGLHFDDIKKLLEILHTFVEQGNTVIVIEHNLEVIKTADWIIDLGPEGGDNGGYIVAQGTPESIVKNPASMTGVYLKPYL